MSVDDDASAPVDDVERRAGGLSCCDRLIQLHRLSRVAPTDRAMIDAMSMLRYIQDSGMIMPGLYPDVINIGGMSMEWTLRTPSAGFETIILDVSADGRMAALRLPDGCTDGGSRSEVSEDDAKRFLKRFVPDDDGM